MKTNRGEEHAYDLFISHAEANRAWVEGYLLDALTQAGVRCHSEEAFALGVPRLLEFERAVQQSRRTLLILSPAYLAEGFSQFTDLLAQSYGLEMATWPVIPLILHPVKLPPRLAMLTALDATDPAHWTAVVERLCSGLQRPVPGLAPRPPCPYPGMVPFRAEDARFFYGRDDEIRQMLQHLRHQRFLFVIGPSGCGKSSLISAGLLPQLAQSSYFPQGFWLVRDMRPGSQPMRTLAQAVGGDLSQPAQVLANLLAAHLPAQRLLLAIDQFEELFAQAEHAEQGQFITTLQALRAVESCALLIAMRADFYADLMNSDLWPVDPSQRLEIAPLRGEALRQAIQKPAQDEKVRVYLEAGLLERLLADAAGEPGVLPLVQETMVLLWSEMQRRLLPLSAYERLGGEGRSGLAVAIATKADATLADMKSAAQRAIARRVFLRLVQFGEGRPDMRRQQPVAALRSADDDPKEFDRTLEHLTRNRLLTLSGEERGDGRRVDIAHEALIGGWPTLGGWLAERREAEQTRRRLEAKAAEWVRLGWGSGGLLDEVELLEAERWLVSPDAADLGYSEALPALVQASREAIEKAEREKEAARQRELEFERARAEAERQRAEERQRSAEEQARAYSWLETVMRREGREDRRLRRVVLAQALAAQVLHEQLDMHHERAALLARQAYLFHQRSRGSMLSHIDSALRTVLGAPYFRFILRTHGRRAQIAPDGDVLALGGEGGPLHVWNLRQPDAVPTVLRSYGPWAASLAFSPEGHMLASGGADGMVRLWDLRQPDIPHFTLHGSEKRVTALAFSPDGYTLAWGSLDGTVHLWDLRESDATPLALAGHELAIELVAFSANAHALVSVSADGTVRLCDLRHSGAAPVVLRGYKPVGRSRPVSPDGRTLALRDGDGTVWLWDLGQADAPSLALRSQEHLATSLAFSPDGHMLVTGGGKGTVHLWDLRRLDAPPLALRGHEGAVSSLAFSPDGHTLASGGTDRVIRLWDLRQPSAAPIVLDRDEISVEELAFSSDGQVLTSVGGSGTRVWDLNQTRSAFVVLSGHESLVWSLAFSSDGHTLASSGADGALRVWDLRQPRADPIALRCGDARVTSVVFSPEGSRLAIGNEDGTVWLWNQYQPDIPEHVLSHGEPIMSIAFSPDGQTLALGDRAGEGRLWDLRQPNTKPSVINHQEVWGWSVAFSPDGYTLAAGGKDGTVRLWNLQQPGVPPLALRGHEDTVRSVAFSADGHRLASCGHDGTVRLWDLRQPHPLPTVLGVHEGLPGSVAFSADGCTLASGHEDGTVRLWDLRQLDTPPIVLRGHTGGALLTMYCVPVAFGPDDKWLAFGSKDGTIHVWIVRHEVLADMICEKVSRNLTRTEWDRFIGPDLPYLCTCRNLPPGEGAPADAGEYTHDLFISYADAEDDWAEGYLREALTQAGIRVYTPGDFELGVPRLVNFDSAVEESRYTLVVLSPAYLAERWDQLLDVVAQSYGPEPEMWPVIPLLLKSVELPSQLSALAVLDATNSDAWANAIATVLRTMQGSTRLGCSDGR